LPPYLVGAREIFFGALTRRRDEAESGRGLVSRLLIAHGMVVGARFKVLQRWFVGALALGGCAYQPDSFSQVRQPFDGVYVTVSCLDLAIRQRTGPDTTSNVVEYRFGNRCDDPVVVDLASAHVYGSTSEGTAMNLFAFDPFDELRELRLDARGVGHESIDYPSDETLEHVCIDAASIAHVYPPRWVCFHNRH
jgi:hypothetical protein